jgi:hypothetical protein
MDVEDIVNYLIITAIIAVFVLAATGKFLDLSVERQSSVQTRSTINLLQKIVTDGPILVKDPAGGDRKIAIDLDRLEKIGPDDLSTCCDSIQFDYQLDVGIVKEDSDSSGGKGVAVTPNYVIQTAKRVGSVKNYEPKPGQGPTDYDIGNQCYYEFGIGQKRAATLPVNICKNVDGVTFCGQGIARLETTDSPLSQLSYWLTQVCNSQYDTQKRIPLSKSDYVTGLDLSIEEDEKGKKVCLKGLCKRFVCNLPVSNRVDSTLLNNNVGSLFSCHFAVVEKKGNKMTLYEGYEQPEGEIKATKFPPNDEFTEDNTEIYTFNSNNFEVVNSKVDNIDSQKNEKYIVFKIKNDGNLHDEPVYLDVSKVADKFPQFSEELDCGNGKKCIKMMENGKVKYPRIKYNARIYSEKKKDPMRGSLTWKLTDTNGNCIEKKFITQIDNVLGLGFGQGKQIINNKDWTPLEINLLKKDQIEGEYIGCGGNPRDFNWQITRIEWNVCEQVLKSSDEKTLSCVPDLTKIDPTVIGELFKEIQEANVDSIEYLMLDDLYFEGSG